MGLFSNTKKKEDELRDALLKKIWNRVKKLSDDETVLEIYADLRTRVYHRDTKSFIDQVHIYTSGPYIKFRGRDVSDGSARTVYGSNIPLALLKDIYSQSMNGLVVSGLTKSVGR